MTQAITPPLASCTSMARIYVQVVYTHTWFYTDSGSIPASNKIPGHD
ncbi:MAG: hypothetical protein JNK20_13820 [Flavipsychrobacter sp.]|nr:hypothetical protein [Flavipsychrobacter sp.]